MSELPGPGACIGGYRLERILGRGGMGTVYLATQEALGRQVALKILHPHKVVDAQAAAGFFAEARAAGRLAHPHLVTVHDLFASPEHGLFCYAMEFVPGDTLAHLVETDGPLTRMSALGIIREVASALAEAHRQGLVHRDVKPANILITPGGRAKLLDLGLAANRLGALGTAGVTPGGRRLSIIGTPEFMAPEQGRDPEAAQPASDVWSLGATLVYLMTGQPPFTGATVIDLIVRAAMDPLVLPGDFPDDIRALLARMLAKAPRDRPQDGQAVVELLQAVESGRFTAPTPPPPSLPPPAPSSVPRRRPPVRRRAR